MNVRINFLVQLSIIWQGELKRYVYIGNQTNQN